VAQASDTQEKTLPPPDMHRAEQALAWLSRRPGVGAAARRAVALARLTYRSRHAVLPLRTELPFLLNRQGLTGCGVEVGVKRGEFSELLLDGWRGAHLVSVDPWRAAPGGDYEDVANVEQEEHDRFHAETVARLARFGPRSSIWRETGEAAAARIPHHSLDFVYLDARHDYESVLSDLADWLDKVRPGGIFAGHDYLDGRYPEGEFGVKSAVDEFFAGRGLKVRATVGDGPWRSWWVKLPRR
jgi:hypothetical protein